MVVSHLHRKVTELSKTRSEAASSGSPHPGSKVAVTLFAAEPLFSLRHTRIGIVAGSRRHLYSRARVDGFRAVAEAAAPGEAVISVVHGNWDRGKAEAVTHSLFDADPAITAVFACSDTMALGVYGGQTPAGKAHPMPVLAAALQAEAGAYIERFAGERDGNGRRLVVRNGNAKTRTVLTSAGAVEVTAPRVNGKRTGPGTGQRQRFSSAILPPWARKTPQVSDVLPLLYLQGLSSGDFVPALGQFPGSSAGLSSPVITRLTEAWKGRGRCVRAA